MDMMLFKDLFSLLAPKLVLHRRAFTGIPGVLYPDLICGAVKSPKPQ